MFDSVVLANILLRIHTLTFFVPKRLGSKIRSKSTGIVMNDEMDDFGTPGKSNSYGVPPSPANFIAPGKRPLSSMCPVIILDQLGNVRLLIGGAGGIKITSSVAYVSVFPIWSNLVEKLNIHFRRSYDICIGTKRYRMPLMPNESITSCYQ